MQVEVDPDSAHLGHAAATTSAPELTILMPCLNEAETIGICIEKAQAFLASSEVVGEVLIADNGSTDGSQQIAVRHGARVLNVVERGYGAALIAGIAEARGRYLIMGDGDDSYDFVHLLPFVEGLRAGCDLVMGNRFKGGIAPHAMPFLHQYLGNPGLSQVAQILFQVPVGDLYCGLRGFRRDRILALNLRSTGMEFALEMVVRSAMAGYRIEEVPTSLKKDGRSRPPHLRTWRDGWRGLSFLLMHSPRWLFLYPGLLLCVIGLLAATLLLPGSIVIEGVGFDLHTFTVGCAAVVVGVQSISFAVIVHRYAAARRLIPRSSSFSTLIDSITFERMLILGVLIGVIGLCGILVCVATWASTSFGALNYSSVMRLLVISLTGLMIGIQLVLTGFLSGIIEIPIK